MDSISDKTVTCPFCWETNHVMIETEDVDQQFIVDCTVCCQPMELQVMVSDEDTIKVIALHQDDQ